MSSRLNSLILKEIVQFSRDPVVIGMVLYFYTLCVALCAYSLTFDVKRIPMAVVDYDHSPASRALIEAFAAGDAFDVVSAPQQADTAMDALARGDVRLSMIIPENFERDLLRNDRPALQVVLDGANSNTADFARGYVMQIVNFFGAEAKRGGHANRALIRPVIRYWYNPDQSFTSFMVLSMIAANALMVAMVHPAAGFVREKEAGTIEQLMVTPLTVGEIFVAKTLPTLGMGLVSVFPSLLIAALFHVPFRGSLLLFLALTTLFLLSGIALGVAVATVARTLQQALLLAFFGLFPLMFLSGSLVPVESMPPVLQKLSLLSPLRYYMDVILGIFLKGASLRDLWPQAVALAAIGASLYTASLVLFRRTLT